MSTDEKDEVTPPELPVFRGDDVPVYDLGGEADQEPDTDDEPVVHDLDDDQDDAPVVHDLDGDEDDAPVIHHLDGDEDDEPVVYDLDDDEDDDITVYDLDEEGDEEISVHDLGSDDDEDIPLHDLGGDDDETPVYDLSTRQDRESVLAEALAHAATQEAQYKQPIAEVRRTGLWKTPLAMAVFALSAYLLVFPPPWVTGSDFPVVSDAQMEHGTRAALFLQAQQVEAFRVREGRLPTSLGEMEGALPDIQFVRSNNRVFQLVAPGVTGPNIIYDSTRPTEEFLAAAAGWGVHQR